MKLKKIEDTVKFEVVTRSGREDEEIIEFAKKEKERLEHS